MKMLALLLTVVSAAGAAEEVLFEDAFQENLAEGWRWLREDRDDWRVKDGALEIRATPGDANSVRNALLRPLPDADGPIAIEVSVTFTADLSEQYEQAGLTWYADDAPAFKLVHELIDGEYFVVPGKIPCAKKTVRLRLEVKGDKYVAKFREEGETDYRVAAEGDLAKGKDNQISLQCYHGPAAGDHWMRFQDFKILKMNP